MPDLRDFCARVTNPRTLKEGDRVKLLVGKNVSAARDPKTRIGVDVEPIPLDAFKDPGELEARIIDDAARLVGHGLPVFARAFHRGAEHSHDATPSPVAEPDPADDDPGRNSLQIDVQVARFAKVQNDAIVSRDSTIREAHEQAAMWQGRAWEAAADCERLLARVRELEARLGDEAAAAELAKYRAWVDGFVAPALSAAGDALAPVVRGLIGDGGNVASSSSTPPAPPPPEAFAAADTAELLADGLGVLDTLVSRATGEQADPALLGPLADALARWVVTVVQHKPDAVLNEARRAVLRPLFVHFVPPGVAKMLGL